MRTDPDPHAVDGPDWRLWRRVALACIAGVLVLDARPHSGLGQDLAAIQAAGAAVAAGASPYDEAWFQRWVAEHGTTATWMVYSPPPFLLVARVLAYGRTDDVFVGHYVVHAIGAVAGLAAIARWRPEWFDRALLLAATAGLSYTLWVGNVYAGLALLAAVGTHASAPALRGAAIGLLFALKPQYATWVALLPASREARATGAALATAAAVWVAATALLGSDLPGRWFEVAASIRTATSTNASLFGVAARFGIDARAPAAVIALACALRVGQGASPEGTARVATAAALLLSPVSWVGYALVAMPGWWTRGWTAWAIAGWAALAVPWRLVYATDALWWSYPLGAACLLVDALLRTGDSTPATDVSGRGGTAPRAT